MKQGEIFQNKEETGKEVKGNSASVITDRIRELTEGAWGEVRQ